VTTPDLRALAAVLGDDGPADLRLRKGTVVSVDVIPATGPDATTRQQTVTVTLGGSTTQVAARTLGPTPLMAGDAVWLLQQGPLLLVVGTAETRPVATRTIVTPNAFLPAGFYETTPGATGAPDSTSWWHYVVTRHTNDSAWAHQIAYAMQGEQIFHRYHLNGNAPGTPANWSAWVRLPDGRVTEQGGIYRNTAFGFTTSDVAVPFDTGQWGEQFPVSWAIGDRTVLSVPLAARPGLYQFHANIPYVGAAGSTIQASIRTLGGEVLAYERWRVGTADTSDVRVIASRARRMSPADGVRFYVQSDSGTGYINGGYGINANLSGWRVGD
jgi:hypothetical protein